MNFGLVSTFISLEKNEYRPFRKPNDFPVYIDAKSNHPPAIIKQIPSMINQRLSNLSSNQKIFDEEKSLYVMALKNSGHPCDLKYIPPCPNKRKRARKPIYYNPPFSLNVRTNIGAAFLRLIDKHFPKGHKLHKYFNRSKVKVSYCTMTNMKKQINRHNAKILRDKVDDLDARTCNCRGGRECPLNGQCLQKSVVYQANVDCRNTVKTYYGLTENTFKARWNNHQSNLRNTEQSHKTSLSSYVWKCKNDHLEPKITWSIKAKAYALSSGGKQCDLCLTEKLTILMADPKSTLNKRDEIMAKCKHKRKYILGTVKPTITEQEPPDPT